jgi:hypothetical protein
MFLGEATMYLERWHQGFLDIPGTEEVPCLNAQAQVAFGILGRKSSIAARNNVVDYRGLTVTRL